MLESTELDLPDLDTQARIAEILWSADSTYQTAMTALEKMRLALKVVFRSKYEAWKKENPTAEKKVVADAISDIVAGKSPVGTSEPAMQEEYGVLKVSAVGALAYHEQENKCLVNSDDFVSELEVVPGFLLMTRANASLTGVGRVCVVHKTRTGLMLSDKTLRLIENQSVVRQRFLLEALRARLCRRHIEANANGTEAKNISQARIRSAPIWLPDLHVQDEVVSILQNFDSTISRLEEHCRNIESMNSRLREHLLVNRSEKVCGGGA